MLSLMTTIWIRSLCHFELDQLSHLSQKSVYIIFELDHIFDRFLIFKENVK